VVNAVLNHLSKVETGDLRPGIAHRLDKNTSGVLVVAKNQKTLENLKHQFKNKKIKKTYLALVHGVVAKEKGIITENIIRHPKFRSKFTVGQEGREAETAYQVLQRLGSYTLLQLNPKTGRTHQIRVHLAHLGHPIVGDKLYGGKMLLNRQFLHAQSLELTHPKTGKTMVFEAALPEDLDKFLKKLTIV
jgi:23S rRNA pseudouridine1911/1915/1917 synthase